MLKTNIFAFHGIKSDNSGTKKLKNVKRYTDPQTSILYNIVKVQ